MTFNFTTAFPFMRVFKSIENLNFGVVCGDFAGTPWAIALKLISVNWLVLSFVPVNFRDCLFGRSSFS